MTNFIYDLPSWVLGVLIVGIASAFAGLGTIVAQRLVPLRVRAEHNEIAGFISAMVGVVYAVFLAFLAIAVWEAFGKAEVTVRREASAAGDIWVDSRPYPLAVERQVRKAVEDYLTAVVEDEWPLQQRGKVSLKAWRAVETLHRLILDYQPETPAQQIAHTEIFRKMNELLAERRSRIFINENAIQAEVWIVLLLGSALAIAFTWFFGTENARAHVAMTTMLGASIGLALFLVVSMDGPFRGRVSVDPAPFERVRETLKRLAVEQPPVEAPALRRRR